MSAPPVDPLLHRHGSRMHRHAYRRRHRHLGLALQASTPIAGPKRQVESRQGRGQCDRRSESEGVEHGHSHGLVDESIKRSSEGIRAVLRSLGILGITAAAQSVVFMASGSVALLADLVHNFGDALTAVPLAIAFLLRSEQAERRAGLVVVTAIAISAGVVGVEAIRRVIQPAEPSYLAVMAVAGAVGFCGNYLAARIRTRTGERIGSPALIADGHHARADAYVSLGVVASAAVVALGFPLADPLIGLAITAVILRITWQSWRSVRGSAVAD